MEDHDTIEQVQLPTSDNDHSTVMSDEMKYKMELHKSSVMNIMDSSTARKIERLVAWNTELLLQLMKHIVARRSVVSTRKVMPAALFAMAQNISSGGMVVDEVTEIIQLPDFDERLSSKKIELNTVVLSPEVVAQTRRFVSLIASMYRDNPFHNFEVWCSRLLLYRFSISLQILTVASFSACFACYHVSQQAAIPDRGSSD